MHPDPADNPFVGTYTGRLVAEEEPFRGREQNNQLQPLVEPQLGQA